MSEAKQGEYGSVWTLKLDDTITQEKVLLLLALAKQAHLVQLNLEPSASQIVIDMAIAGLPARSVIHFDPKMPIVRIEQALLAIKQPIIIVLNDAILPEQAVKIAKQIPPLSGLRLTDRLKNDPVCVAKIMDVLENECPLEINSKVISDTVKGVNKQAKKNYEVAVRREKTTSGSLPPFNFSNIQSMLNSTRKKISEFCLHENKPISEQLPHTKEGLRPLLHEDEPINNNLLDSIVKLKNILAYTGTFERELRKNVQKIIQHLTEILTDATISPKATPAELYERVVACYKLLRKQAPLSIGPDSAVSDMLDKLAPAVKAYSCTLREILLNFTKLETVAQSQSKISKKALDAIYLLLSTALISPLQEKKPEKTDYQLLLDIGNCYEILGQKCRFTAKPDIMFELAKLTEIYTSSAEVYSWPTPTR